MDTPTEEQLIEAARHGDVAAFNQLVLAYQGKVYTLAYRLLGEAENAADVTQETFLAAFQHIGAFQKGSLHAWLLRIATNLCYDVLRRHRAHPTSPLEILFTRPDSPEPQDSEGTTSSPEAYAEQQELAAEIQRALATLPPEQRAAVVLCDVEGFPYKEAARILGISQGTLKSRLSRGRIRLRDYLYERGELLPLSLRSILGRFEEEPGPADMPKDLSHEAE